MADGEAPVNNRTSAEIRIQRLSDEARRARNTFQSVYNNFYSLAAPWRSRVGKKATASNPQAPSEQDEIFDTTLQDAVDDWASDCADEFTPSYKPWTKHVVVGGLSQFSKTAQEQVKKLVSDRMQLIYDDIRASAFAVQSQEFYVDIAIAPSGMDIPYTKAGEPLSFEHCPTAELLILPSPFGGPGDRFREREIEVRMLDAIWPNANWTAAFGEGSTKEIRQKTEGTATILQAHERNWENLTEEEWRYTLLCNNRQIMPAETTKGPGSCRLVVCRPRVSAPSAYGVGVANKAIAPSRTLQTLAYLALKREGRNLDPPTVYSDDGTLNVEGGVDTGKWYEAGIDFEIKELVPQNDARESFFVQEDLRSAIRRALFQDKPYQRGDTPPTATQWMDEQSMNARRKGFPRERITDEFVLPVLRRIDWIKRKRGEIEDMEVEKKLVRLEPISPMSRASDINEVQMADQHLAMFAARFGPGVMDYYNMPETMEAAREKLGTTVIVPATAEEAAKKQQERAQTEAMAKAGGAMAAGGQE